MRLRYSGVIRISHRQTYAKAQSSEANRGSAQEAKKLL